MKDSQFDHIISSKLDALRANPSHADWDKLQAKIDMDMQSDSFFDSSILNKVSQLSSGIGTTPDWDVFSHKLHQTAKFDQVIKQKLHNIPTNKVSEHWLILQERLQGIRYLKQSILSLKVGESLLMMCLLLCFANFSQYLFPPQSQQEIEMAMVIENNGEQVVTNEITNNGQALIVDVNPQEQEIALSQIESTDEVVSTITSQPVVDAPLKVNNWVSELEISQTTNSVTQSSKSQSVNIANKLVENQQLALDHNGVREILASPSTLPVLMSSLQRSITPTLKPMNSTQQSPQDIKKVELDKLERSLSPFAVHTLVGIGGDQIFTPEDQRFGLDDYQHYAVNSDAGLRISYDKNNWSIETGISLQTKGYKPRHLQDTIRVQNVAVIQSLESIEFELITIPLTIKRSMDLRDNLSLYGMAGLEYYSISKESYEIHEDLTQVTIDLKSVSDLEYKVNRPVIHNQSMNYSVGLGLMKSINPIVDVYGQILYRGQLSTQGIGINEDRFNSLSFQAGIKLRLEKRK